MAIVVLEIIAGMIGLLLLEVQRARQSARSAICRDNLRQLNIAAASHRKLTEQFPVPCESWTVTLLHGWRKSR